ncbi:MAG: hypothetical protein NTX66_01510 [Candidatus Falkowbacteria bacterium]|nr:hypothetical protein [Candidatus Falkowbacteria bacterium]
MYEARVPHFKCIADQIGLPPGEIVFVMPEHSTKNYFGVIPGDIPLKTDDPIKHIRLISGYLLFMPSIRRHTLQKEIELNLDCEN